MYKIAAVGDGDSIYGFASLGLDIYPVETSEEAASKLKNLASGGYAVIYITEALAAQIPEEIDKYREQVMPAVILIPGISGNTGEGMRRVRESVEKAVGSDILS